MIRIELRDAENNLVTIIENSSVWRAFYEAWKANMFKRRPGWALEIKSTP